MNDIPSSASFTAKTNSELRLHTQFFPTNDEVDLPCNSICLSCSSSSSSLSSARAYEIQHQRPHQMKWCAEHVSMPLHKIISSIHVPLLLKHHRADCSTVITRPGWRQDLLSSCMVHHALTIRARAERHAGTCGSSSRRMQYLVKSRQNGCDEQIQCDVVADDVKHNEKNWRDPVLTAVHLTDFRLLHHVTSQPCPNSFPNEGVDPLAILQDTLIPYRCPQGYSYSPVHTIATGLSCEHYTQVPEALRKVQVVGAVGWLAYLHAVEHDVLPGVACENLRKVGTHEPCSNEYACSLAVLTWKRVNIARPKLSKLGLWNTTCRAARGLLVDSETFRRTRRGPHHGW